MERLSDDQIEAARKTWAILKTGGKQYRVRPGDRLDIARSDFLAATVRDAAGRQIFTFDDILMLGLGDRTLVGQPRVLHAKVLAELLPERRGPKVIAFKKRRRQNSRRRRGSRQVLQPVRIISVEHDAVTATPPASPIETRARPVDAASLLSRLRDPTAARLADALGEVIGANWHAQPSWLRVQVARAVEPLLTAPTAPLRTLAASALSGIVGPGHAAPDDMEPPSLVRILNRHFAATGQRYFLDVTLQRDEDVPQAPKGSARYQARIGLHESLHLPGECEPVRLQHPLQPSARVEMAVSGLGVYGLANRMVERRERPTGVLREAVIDFENDGEASHTAVLDIVIDGRRVERRFLALNQLAIQRDPPPASGRRESADKVLGPGPDVDIKFA